MHQCCHPVCGTITKCLERTQAFKQEELKVNNNATMLLWSCTVKTGREFERTGSRTKANDSTYPTLGIRLNDRQGLLLTVPPWVNQRRQIVYMTTFEVRKTFFYPQSLFGCVVTQLNFISPTTNLTCSLSISMSL